MSEPFLPVARMVERAKLAREESDTAYFMELLYLGEMALKTLVVELIACLDDDRERHKYGLEHRLIRADGIGEWTAVFDEVLTGPASQQLTEAGRDSQRAMVTSVGPREDVWQRRAADSMTQLCLCLDAGYEDTTKMKTSLRHWARKFVWLRNRTRGHGAPRQATLATICPMLELSLNEVLDNAPAFARSWAHLKQNLSGKYRVSSFGGDKQLFARFNRETGHHLTDGVYIYLDNPRPVSLLFTDPDLTDFLLPNGNYRNDRFETLSYITDERRTEDGSYWNLPIEFLPASETTAKPALDVVGNVFTNIPPRRDGYVPRAILEEELGQVLRDDRHPVVTLHGRGGVGKTSLALEVLHDLALEEDFHAIVWFSARDIDLLPQGPRVVRPDVLSTDDIARDFNSLMRPEKVTKLEDARRFFTDCLAGQEQDGPFLFVFDNFETLREQSALYSYVSNAIRLPSKALITSRARDFKADYPVEVHGMTRDEFHELVREVSAELKIEGLVNDEYEEKLFDQSDGHPYIAKVLLGEVARAGQRVSLKRVVATREAMLDALFDRSFASLSLASQRIFLTLCGWRSLVPRIGLEAVVLRPGNERLDVDRSLTELAQASLVEQVQDPGGAAYLSVPLAAALFGKRKLLTNPFKIAIEADLELIQGFGAMTTTEMPRGLAPRVDRLTRELASRAGDVEELTQGMAVIEYIATEFPPAWLNLAELQNELGDRPASIDSVNRYLESCPEDQAAWQRLVALYRAADDTRGEMHARLQLVELTNPPFNELSTAAARLNYLLTQRELDLDADARRLMVRRLRQLMEGRKSEADASGLSRLAWLCMRDQDFAAAQHWAEEGLKLDASNEHCLGLLRRLGVTGAETNTEA